jgi:hypothetical protein
MTITKTKTKQQMLVWMQRKGEPLYTVAEEVGHYGNQFGVSSKKLKIQLLYD